MVPKENLDFKLEIGMVALEVLNHAQAMGPFGQIVNPKYSLRLRISAF